MTINFAEMKRYTRAEWNEHHGYFSFVLSKAKEKQIESFVDLGACLGEVSKLLIDVIPTLNKIIAIEAMPNNFNFLKENLKSDKCDITYINKAVYYGKSHVTMGTSHSNVGGFGIHDEGILNNHEQVHENIETITLEEILKDSIIDFMKMDIEGAEKNVIENSTALKHVRLIELELHDALAEEEIHSKFLEKHLPNHKIIQRCYRGQAGNNVLLELA